MTAGLPLQPAPETSPPALKATDAASSDDSAPLPIAAETGSIRRAHRGRPSGRAWRRCLAASGALHLALGVMIVSLAVWPQLHRVAGKESPSPVSTAVLRETTPELPVPATLMTEPAPAAVEHLTPSMIAGSALDQLIRNELQHRLDQTDDAARPQKLDELAAQLQAMSSEERVDRMSQRIASTMQLPARAEAPGVVADANAIFDHRTAQVDDVRLETDGPVSKYIATMVDASGLTREVELDQESGAELLRVFGLMKQYPLLAQVYRKVVMSMLDGMLNSTPTSSARTTGAVAPIAKTPADSPTSGGAGSR